MKHLLYIIGLASSVYAAEHDPLQLKDVPPLRFQEEYKRWNEMFRSFQGGSSTAPAIPRATIDSLYKKNPAKALSLESYGIKKKESHEFTRIMPRKIIDRALRLFPEISEEPTMEVVEKFSTEAPAAVMLDSKTIRFNTATMPHRYAAKLIIILHELGHIVQDKIGLPESAAVEFVEHSADRLAALRIGCASCLLATKRIQNTAPTVARGYLSEEEYHQIIHFFRKHKKYCAFHQQRQHGS